jgi:osmotically-inducible protein OsmY
LRRVPPARAVEDRSNAIVERRELAERPLTSNIVGALDVTDQIELAHPTPRPKEVRALIQRAWKRNAALEADDLHIQTTDGNVTIEGSISSWTEHDEAIEATWAAPGVRSVDDRLTVVY